MADIEQPAWRCKHRIGELMGRLRKHSQGEIEMTQSQIAAARLYLDKTLPSLSSVAGNQEHSGKIEHVVRWGE